MTESIQYNEPSELSQASFVRLAQYVTSELGIKMPESKLLMVQSRLQRRIRELGLESPDQYAEYLFASSNPEEREHFVNAITTHKTDFFREPEHFTYLLDVVLPEFTAVPANRGRRFKAWCAGCSSGEEAYTLGMVLAEYGLRVAGFDFAILATDVASKILTAARAGIYSEALVAPVPPELRRKYLLRSRDRSDNKVRIAQALRSKVSFHELNFMAEDYAIKDVFDVVFFRNVMIYFERTTQEAVVNKICRNLTPGGYLFVGHSESLSGLDIPLRSVKVATYRKTGWMRSQHGTL
jgi:chemotaxis protein methyltransferase CheR